MIDWSKFDHYTQRAVMTKEGITVVDVTSEVLALRTNDDGQDCLTKAVALALKGVAIDKSVEVDHWDAKHAMEMRRDYGFAWCTPLLMKNVEIAPGVDGHFSHLDRYDPTAAPIGAIMVPPF